MDRIELIKQRRQQRLRQTLKQAQRDDRQLKPSYYAGPDVATGQPLVRSLGGGAVPIGGISNVQAEVGQQGRADGRGFDVGNRRSGSLNRRRISSVDALYAVYFLSQAGSYYKAYSLKDESPLLPDSSYPDGFYRPSVQTAWGDVQVWTRTFGFVPGGVDFIDSISPADGQGTRLLTVNSQIGGNGLYVLPNMAIGFNYSEQVSTGVQNRLTGIAYPVSIFGNGPLPFEFDDIHGEGDVINVSSSYGVNVGGLSPKFRVSSKTTLNLPILDSFILGVLCVSKDGNYLLFKNNASGPTFQGMCNGTNFDASDQLTYPNNGVISSYKYQFIFTAAGDLNRIFFPQLLLGAGYTAPNAPEFMLTTIQRLAIVNNSMQVVQTKNIPLPTNVKNATELLAINLPDNALISTGRGIMP